MPEFVECPFFLGAFDAQHYSRIPSVFAKKKDVDYLLIAKPVAFNHLGIRHDCAVSFIMIRSVVGSSH